MRRQILTPPPPDPGRRHFLGACCAAVGSAGLLSALAQLRMLGAIVQPGSASAMTAATAASDYRALVCLFLAGGNDANNLIVPTGDSDYAAYTAARGALALPRSVLLPLNPRTSDGRTWAFHPALAGLHGLFGSGQAAVLANVGTLLQPTTKAQYQAKSVPLPPQLFSHSNQQVEWQSSLADKPFVTGWGGRLADLLQALNENNTISMSISLNGQNSFQVGRAVAQFVVNETGVTGLTGASTSTATVAGQRTRALNELLASSDTHNLFEAAFAGVTRNAITDSSLVAGVLGASTAGDKSAFPRAYGTFPGSSLGLQLRTIARLIAARDQFSLRRQVFFARIAGWDLHDNQVVAGATHAGAHANLFADLSRSLTAFHGATVEMGVAESVTTFTASDFGRTYNTNGDGTDHAWGSHHLIVGGAVRGGELYGRMPALELGGPDDIGRGRWIPTTSVDEYSATLARWFGVSATDLPIVLPNIGRFARPDLGFMT
ncbi:MAG TPA: DUF1501 domain-containing protein [Opitutaceae bacterium]